MSSIFTKMRERGIQMPAASLSVFKPTKKHLLALSAAVLVGTMVLPLTANAATFVIDVRTPEEYQVSHPAGAINIPHHQLVEKIANQGVSKADTIKVYSRGGSRAEQAKNTLMAAGYTKVEIHK